MRSSTDSRRFPDHSVSPQILAILARAHWQSARSVEAVAPHQYVVIGWDKDDLTEAEFWAVRDAIRALGRREVWRAPRGFYSDGRRPEMVGSYLYVKSFAHSYTKPSKPMLNRERGLRSPLFCASSRTSGAAREAEGALSADNTLPIEHILPQDWEPFWPVDADPNGTLAEREQARESHVHRLGNLTLVSPRMNPALSNREWESKREQLREHSSLLITQRYLDGTWDETTIRDRATVLIDAVSTIWPGPAGSFTKPVEH